LHCHPHPTAATAAANANANAANAANAARYINHGAVLFKVFVVGEKWVVVKRPSIRNLSADGDL